MTVHPVDLTSAEFKRNPFPTFAKLREIGPIVKVKLPLVGECWVTSTYEAADKVLRDKEHFCTDALNAGLNSRTSFLGVLQWFMPRAMKHMIQNMLTMDEPDHRRLRSLVEAAFAKQSVDALRQDITSIVDRQLDEMELAANRDGTVDFQHEFAKQVPLAVICELLGLPEEDREQFAAWCDFSSASGTLGMLWAMRKLGRLQQYLQEQFAECRRNSRPGMISALVQAEQDGERLSEEELFASVLILLIAGHETTTHLITIGLLALQQHSEVKAELMADWSKRDAAVDEMLRYNSTIQGTKPRYVRQDMEFYGQQIREGEFFIPLLAAANCDPAVFENPERFDIKRSPNNHMAFGRGIHVCLGLKLAKAEAGIAFERLLTRFPNIQLAIAEDQLRWTERTGARSLYGLPVSLKAESGVQVIRDAA